MTRPKKKSSTIQLPESYWIYLEEKALGEISSVSAIVRKSVFSWIIADIIGMIKKVEPETFPTLRGLLYREFLTDANVYYDVDFTNKYEAERYYSDNPDKLLATKKRLVGAFLDILDAQLDEILSFEIEERVTGLPKRDVKKEHGITNDMLHHAPSADEDLINEILTCETGEDN